MYPVIEIIASHPAAGGTVESLVLREPEFAEVVQQVRRGLGFGEFHAIREVLRGLEEHMAALLGRL